MARRHGRGVLAALLLAAASAGYAAAPGEVTDLRVGPGGALSWAPAPGATTHAVYRGAVPAAWDHACLAWGLAATAHVDASLPGGDGRLWYYLVAGANPEGEGTLGQGTPGERPRRFPCDADGDLVADEFDNCPAARNPSQADQDDDGEGDRCDPQTYDFEDDVAGLRPAGMTSVGGVAPTFLVRDLGGDLAVAYGAGGGVHDAFDRLEADGAWQDTTIYVDHEDVAETLSVELWSDGAYRWSAGTGIIFQLFADGRTFLYERFGQAVPQVPGPSLPPTGRFRLRLVKGDGATSTVHLDAWDGISFVEDHAVFAIADDHRHRGLAVVLCDYFDGRRAVKRITVNHALPAAAFTLLQDPRWSCDWKVFQRDAAGVATIPLRFAWRLAEPATLRVRIVDAATRLPLPGHDEADHELDLAAAPAGSTGEFDVTGVPTGGNYDVEARIVRAADGSAVGGGFLQSVAVGDTYACGGQSNMSGYSGTLAGGELPMDEVHLFANDGTWRRASEPMDDGTDQVDRVSAETPAHSLMLSFAKSLVLSTGVPVGIIPGPLGGTNLHSQWQRDDADHDNRGTLYGSLLHRARLQGGRPPAGYLWFQGESDAIDRRGTAAYEADLRRLAAQVREDLGDPDMPFLVAQLGTFLGADLAQWIPVQEAQRRIAATDARSALVTTVDQPLADPIHFSVAGYREIGRRFATAARRLVHAEAGVDETTDLVVARAGALGTAVELVHERDVTGGDPALFRVADAAGAPAVTGVSSAGPVVTLALDRALSPPATVSYGWSVAWNAAWIEDAAGVPVPVYDAVPVEP